MIIAKLNARINASLNASLASAEFYTRLQSEGVVAMPITREALGQLIRREIERWRPVAQAGNIPPN